jgi:hypothetical protein
MPRDAIIFGNLGRGNDRIQPQLGACRPMTWPVVGRR